MAGKAMDVNDSDFESMILESDLPTLVDFWAEWCGPCKAMGPVIEEIAEEYEGRAVVAKMDVSANNATAVKYGVQGIPLLLFFSGGEVADRIMGMQDKKRLKKSISGKLDALLA